MVKKAGKEPDNYVVGDLESPNGWITGDGTFLATGYREHMYAAEEWFGKDSGKDAEELAERDGWIKISDYKILCWGYGTPLKQRQIDTLWDWYSIHVKTRADWIKYYGSSKSEGQSFEKLVEEIRVYMSDD